jgi:hypothetical protein
MAMFAMDLEVFLFQRSVAVIGVVCVVAAILLGAYASFKGLQDLARFGRADAPWPVAIAFAIILGSGAVWLWGLYGSFVIFAVLAVFTWGKLRPS